jgi:putative transposase
VQTFPSVHSMVRLTCASILEEEGRWATQRTFSEESAALGFAEPAPAEPMADGRRRALERRAEQIVSEIVERHGLKRE